MGRKIPAKKHRGVKDPVEQQAKRLASLKGKINAPPRDPDEQPAPRSLARLFAPLRPRRARADAPPPAYAHGRGAGVGDGGGGGGAGGAVARLRRLPGETARDFSRRISGAVRALHAQHHDLDEEDARDAKGERMAELRARRERRRARRAAGAPRGPGAEAPAPGRARRRALTSRAKQQLKTEAQRAETAAAPVYERVPFGERAHAPPVLRAPRRAPQSAQRAARPARRDLLLTALLQPRAAPAPPTAPAASAASAREAARLRAVAAYRSLKAARCS